MLDESSKIFFGIFFGAIALCITLTYHTIVIKGDFETFTSENAPEATDIYYAIGSVFEFNAE